jgi:phospholipase C
MPPSTMPQITNVVMLMLENRSLDNLFGYLYTAGGPLTFYPKGSPQRYDGIPSGASNPAFDWWGNLKSYPVLPIPVQQLLNEGDDPSIIPWWDPTEEYLSRFGTGHGVLNQIFGDQNMVSTLPPFGTPPTMLGFLQDYWTTETTEAYGGMDILWMFQPSQIPNLSSIARHGAISDAWFSSVPTQTNPNRAYSLVGTSAGRDANQSITAIEQFDLPTIFNALAQSGKACGLYFTDVWQSNQCFTQYTFPQVTNACDEIAGIDQFYTRALNGTLLPFTYLEPTWGYGISGSIEMTQGTDLHPPTSVTPGDRFVGNVVQSLVRGPQWKNTLLIITFDEHGGTYDHVRPQWGAINPDGLVSENGFNFDLFGVRVPTILMSPYVAPYTVFRAPAGSTYPFDHTSLIKTLLGWAGADIGTAGFFNRMPQAPTFDGVLHRNDTAAADNAAAIQETFGEGPLSAQPETEPPRTNNALFEGVARASVRYITATSRTPEQMLKKIEEYKRDPEAFEASLAALST